MESSGKPGNRQPALRRPTAKSLLPQPKRRVSKQPQPTAVAAASPVPDAPPPPAPKSTRTRLTLPKPKPKQKPKPEPSAQPAATAPVTATTTASTPSTAARQKKRKSAKDLAAAGTEAAATAPVATSATPKTEIASPSTPTPTPTPGKKKQKLKQKQKSPSSPAPSSEPSAPADEAAGSAATTPQSVRKKKKNRAAQAEPQSDAAPSESEPVGAEVKAGTEPSGDGAAETPSKRKKQQRQGRRSSGVAASSLDVDNVDAAKNVPQPSEKVASPSPAPAAEPVEESGIEPAVATPKKTSKKKTPKKNKAPTKAAEAKPATPAKVSEDVPVAAEKEEEAAAATPTPDGGSAKKSKKKAKRTPAKLPTPGRFDLRLPETPAAGGDGEGGGEDEALDSGTPGVTFNQRMTKAKLRLLNMSPLNRLLSVEDRRAAAAEEAGADAKQPGSDEFVPLDGDADEADGKKRRKRTRSAQSKAAKDSAAAADDDGQGAKKRRKHSKAGSGCATGGNGSGEAVDTSQRGVMYLGHIPHGFYEKQMQGFFSQFGEVTRLRLARSRRTGNSRGYAFVEFRDRDVAGIAAEAMDGYLMHQRTLSAGVVPAAKVHAEMFKGAHKSFRALPWSRIERERMIKNAGDPGKLGERSRRIVKRFGQRRARLRELGMKYEFPQVQYAQEKKTVDEVEVEGR